jgi:hypothetical protein
MVRLCAVQWLGLVLRWSVDDSLGLRDSITGWLCACFLPAASGLSVPPSVLWPAVCSNLRGLGVFWRAKCMIYTVPSP